MTKPETNVGEKRYVLVHCQTASPLNILFVESKNEKDDFRGNDILATCVDFDVNFGIHKGIKFENCKRIILYKAYRIDYDFEILNAGLIPKIDTFLKVRVDAWEQNCEA